MKAEKFRKKPIVVEAMRFKANYKGAQAIIDWINAETGWNPDKGTDPPVAYYYGDLTIMMRGSEIHADDGDWIVKGIGGEFYPVKPDIFRKTYEAAKG